MPVENRPWKGLSPEDALRNCSDASLYAAMSEYADAWRAVSTASGHPPSEPVLRHQEYKRRRDAVEGPFLEKLRKAEILASGILKNQREREIVEPSLWDELEIDFGLDELIGYKLIYLKPQFFEPSAIPLNVHDLPRWLDGYIGYRPSLDALQFDNTFRHIVLRGREFTLGEIQGRVVKLLYQATLTGSSAWVNGKILLQEAGSEQSRMNDFMKNTDLKELIESDSRGMYRLKLD